MKASYGGGSRGTDWLKRQLFDRRSRHGPLRPRATVVDEADVTPHYATFPSIRRRISATEIHGVPTG